ncbi:GrpB family protein [Phaeobacter inhibens]|uniref:GrpB family protein n=1 Tax=Phaeobacter inhibens TaxID=221822 RepID=UPI002490F849|nr:GrpB family protein [Phaeobacter inhibens]
MSLVVAPDPTWPTQAQAEADRWSDSGVDGLIEVHHIGSTAVPGLPAKPIIDLIPVFESEAAMDTARPIIEALGFEWLGEFGLPGRRYCRYDDPETGKRQVQAHCYVEGSDEITRHIAFRDALRANAALRAGYAAIKGKCAALHPGDMHGYGDCKSDWVQKIEAHAINALATKETS